eukprot:scaffold212097_cov30-Tisochrysis_lutea.AAC.4
MARVIGWIGRRTAALVDAVHRVELRVDHLIAAVRAAASQALREFRDVSKIERRVICADAEAADYELGEPPHIKLGHI